MLDKDKIKDVLANIDAENYYDAKEAILKDVSDDVDVASMNYIKSGDAFKDFVSSDRFSEAKEDINDVAARYYKKYKNNTKAIQSSLEEDGYDLKEITKIMKIIKDM